MRVVSLVPSSTETLLALGADVVACTQFCERPELTQVRGPKNPDIAAIRELAPDLVVLDRQENRREDAAELEAAGLDLLVSDIRGVDDALGFVADLARRLGVSAPAVDSFGAPSGPVLTAFVPIWRRPWMSINRGTYGASILDRVGCRVVTADAAEHYPTVDLADVAATAPDLVLVPSEPYDFSAAHVDELRDRFDDSLVERVDGQDLFWWGSRTPAAMRRLAAVLDRLRAPQQPGGSEDASAR